MHHKDVPIVVVVDIVVVVVVADILVVIGEAAGMIVDKHILLLLLMMPVITKQVFLKVQVSLIDRSGVAFSFVGNIELMKNYQKLKTMRNIKAKIDASMRNFIPK